MSRLSLYLGASAIALTLAGPVLAADSSEQLQNRVDDLEATIDALRAEIAEIRKTPEFKPSPNFTNTKGDYAFKFRGQIAADVAAFNVRKGTRDFNDGTQLRRARLGIDGMIASDWLYRLEVDVGNASRDDNANQEVDVKDAYVQYKGIDQTVITVGQHKTPNTLEQAIASTDLLFTELPLYVEAFTNRTTAGGDYKAGISARYSDVNWTATLGVFGENFALNGGGGSTGSGSTYNTTPTYKDEGWGPAARLTWAPINGVTETLHLGVSGYWRETGGRRTIQFRSGPEVSVDSTRLVDTGLLAARNYSFIGAELAGQYGPLYLQSEYGRTDVSRYRTNVVVQSSPSVTAAGGSDVSFDGGYVAASWLITGESREYKDGTFARPKPAKPFSFKNGGWGAWEVAARYSTLDLNDGTVLGGKENNYSLGLNWYPNNYLRLMTDYVRFDVKKGAPAVQDQGDAFITRVAVIW